MNLSKRAKKTLATTFALLSIVASQSGFIAGLCTLGTPAGIPLVVSGIGLFLLGGGLAGVPDYGTNIAGWTLFSIGVVLEEKNPGHIAALNEVPNTADQQKQMGVTSEQIQAYNDKLSGTQIQTAYDTLKAQSLTEVRRWATEHKSQIKDIKGLQINAPRIIPADTLTQVAGNLNLDESDAKILLFKTFGTVVQ